MKKLISLFLTFTICIFPLFGCDVAPADSNDSSSAVIGTVDASSGSSDTSVESNEIDDEIQDDKDGSSEYPRDILEGLPYTIVCMDKYNNGAVVSDYQFNDEGKLNDGLYRSAEDLENGTNEDMRVDFEGTSSYNFQITFESNGAYDGFRIIAHNTDFSFSFLKLEIGPDLDNLTEIEFEDDFEITINMHSDNLADFEPANINVIRITITTGTSSSTSFDEISVLGYPRGEADKWLDEDEESLPPESSTPEDLDRKSFLIGSWGADDPEIVEKGGSDYKVVITFAADGTGTYSQAGLDLPLTWYTANDVIYMEVALVGPMEKPYTYENGVLYMPDEDGRTTAFVKF